MELKGNFTNMLDVKCPKCNKPMECIDKGEYMPAFRCSHCRFDIILERRIFIGGYKIYRTLKIYKCKKNHTFRREDRCEECEAEKEREELRRLNFTEEQQKYLSYGSKWTDYAARFKELREGK